MSKEIVFIENKSEITAGTRGASLGPEAIYTAARKQQNYLFGKFPIVKIKDQNHLLDQATAYPFAKRIDGLKVIYQQLNDVVSAELKAGKFPFVIAADHGSAGGTIAGIKSAFPTKRIGVVWIDAHADIHTPYTTPSGNMHGMPLGTALATDNLPCKINEVDDVTKQLWNDLKQMGGIAPKVLAEDIVYVAVRDTEEQEDAIMAELGIKNYSVEEVNQKSIQVVFDEIQSKLAACDLIYISFDVDSMDPIASSFGTGTPVEQGLLVEDAKQLLNLFAQQEKTVCIEVVEVNPCLDDQKNKMAETAFEIIDTLVKTITQ